VFVKARYLTCLNPIDLFREDPYSLKKQEYLVRFQQIHPNPEIDVFELHSERIPRSLLERSGNPAAGAAGFFNILEKLTII
jgi:hypothetical protein